MGKALEYDRSLLERLYTDMTLDVLRTMLDVSATLAQVDAPLTHTQVQYRFPEELALFPSNAFYEGRLRTDMRDSAAALAVLKLSAFPWPVVDGVVKPVVFMDCAAEENMGGSSKSNEGQAVLVARTVELLCQAKSDAERDAFEARTLSITALTPYSKQVKALHAAIPARFGAAASTIDSFQGRESDLIIFSTVRANAEHDIGFVDDARRLNVAWTRAKLGLILIGSRDTMTANPLWKRAIASCTEVRLPEVAET
jgi:superfamily I DNA and/or RNA helicase